MGPLLPPSPLPKPARSPPTSVLSTPSSVHSLLLDSMILLDYLTMRTNSVSTACGMSRSSTAASASLPIWARSQPVGECTFLEILTWKETPSTLSPMDSLPLEAPTPSQEPELDRCSSPLV